MSLRLINIISNAGSMQTIADIAERFHALSVWTTPAHGDESAVCHILARPEEQQDLIDQLQGAVSKQKAWRIVIMPVDATIPEIEKTEQPQESREQAIREELYAEIDRGARIDSTFVQLVVLSTIVAAIGLLNDNIAIVIAAMLIAPLLGPNVAMAFGSTLGDRELITRAAVANLTGIAISVGCAALVGLLVPATPGPEMIARTRLGFNDSLLALATGAAGALSLTTQLSSALVGVMVGVALLPPAAALGYMIGIGNFRLAAGAAALLAANIVCINISAQLVFLLKGIKPRKWIERRAAQQSTRISLSIAFGLLVVLMAIVYLQR